MDTIKKLKNNKIFKIDSIVESTIMKSWMGAPVEKKAYLIVKKLQNNDCICEEYNESDGISHKIRYLDITTIDGMDPKELAAVYGLAPKTERFNKRRNQ